MATRGTNVLIVDDEPALLESMRVYLARRGHTVTAFGNSASAWDHFAADPSACPVIIVDLTMPGMSGAELIRRMLERSAAVSVLAVSGYPDALRDLNLPDGARIGLLEKPFTPGMLSEALDKLLGEEPAAAGSARRTGGTLTQHRNPPSIGASPLFPASTQ